MRAGALLGEPPLYGLLVGTLAAAAVASAVFLGWMNAALRELEAAPSGEPGVVRA
jgi:hypothetical protein